MSTIYPNGIDSNTTIPQTIDLITPVKADVVNNLRSAVLAIEAELGIDPSREYANVRDRLDFLENFGGARGRIDIYDNGTLIVEKAEKIDFSGCVSVTAGTNYTAEVLISGAQQKQESFVGIVGQTAFLLSVRPLDHTAVLMFINGIKQQYGTDYVAAGQAVMYSGIDYTIQNGDTIEFWYVINGTMVSARQKQESFTAGAGQTVYTISFTPMDRTSVQMFINGSKQRYGTDYVVVGTTATYIGTDYVIQAGDEVEFWYIVGGGIVAGNDLTIIDGYTVVSTHVNTLRFVGPEIGVSVDTGDAATITFSVPRNLSTTLAGGNETDGYDIEISAGDNIVINGPVDIGPAVEIVPTGLNVYGDGYISGKLTVKGLIDPTGLVLDSAGVVPGGNPSVGKATLWVKSGDGYVVLTDSTGSSSVVGGVLVRDYAGTIVSRSNELQINGGYVSSSVGRNLLTLGRVDVREYGAKCDGITDDTVAVQTAVNSLNNASSTKLGGGILFIPNNTRITNTITVDKQAIHMEGEGWGKYPTFVWGGAAGISVLKFTDCYGVVVKNIWIEGNPAAAPSAGIELYRIASHTVGTNGQFLFEGIYIGAQSWKDGADGYCAVGFLVDGTNGNNDEFHLTNVSVRRCTRGISIVNSQSIWGHLQDVLVANALDTGIYTQANILGTNLTFNRNAVDLTTDLTAQVQITQWSSEHCEKMAYLGESSQLSVIGGVIRLTDVVANLIDGEPTKRYFLTSVSYIQSLILRDVSFAAGDGYEYIVLQPTLGTDLNGLVPIIELDNVRGLVLPDQLAVDPVDANDSRHVIINCEGFHYNKVMTFPETLDLSEDTIYDAIINTDTNTTNLQNCVNDILAVMRGKEFIKWPEVPNSILLGDNEGWWNATDMGYIDGYSVVTEIDYSGNARDSIQAIVSDQPTAKGVGTGSYIRFDGYNDLTSAGTAANFQFFHESSWTFAAVVRIPVSEANADYCMFATYDGHGGNAGTSIEYDDRVSAGVYDHIRVRTSDGGAVTTVTTPNGTFSPNTWHTLLVWRHNNIITIEIDGYISQSDTVATPTLTTLPTGALRTGCLVGGVGFAQMDVAMRAIWSRSFNKHYLGAIRYYLDEVKNGL